MHDCLTILLFPVFILLVAVQIGGRLWCAWQLRRWRSVPEFYGLDWLDIVWRLKREFGVALIAADFETIPPAARVELTAGQLWELVTVKLRAAGGSVPADGWERMVGVLRESLSVSTTRIAPTSRLYGDLGMMYGLE